MVTDPGEDASQPTEPSEEEGGPIKPFLEHLEDLRWTLMKSVSFIALGILICLFAAPYLVAILSWPLKKAERLIAGKQQSVTLQIGTNILGTYHLGTNQIGSLSLDTNLHHLTLQLVPVEIDGNHVLSAVIRTNSADLVPSGRTIQLLNLGPASSFIVSFKMAIYGGIIMASPFIIYFLAQFILPALRINEKKYLRKGFLIGTGLFLVGVGFCYLVMMPIALAAAVQYSEWMGFSSLQWTADQFIGFECKFLLGMGLGFELPVVLLILVKIGILDYAKLAAFRRYMIVVCLVLGAILTTPEVITQIMMAIPLYVLYEISVWIAWYWEREEKKRQAAAEASDGKSLSS